MKVILLEDVQGLGKEGELVNAKSGYARNYLIPQNKALLGSKENIANWEEKQAELKAKREEDIKCAQEKKEELDGKSVTVKAKTGEGDRLFGSITAQDIQKAVKEQLNIHLDKKAVELKENIRELGEKDVSIRLYPEIRAQITVKVERL